MRLAVLRPTSRVVLQSFLRDSVQLCACELVDATATTLELRPLDDLPAGIAGQPVTLLTAGQECLVRVSGQVQSVDDGRVQVAVDSDELEEVQRRRFERLTGWLAVKLALALSHDILTVESVEYVKVDDVEYDFEEDSELGNIAANLRLVDFNNENSTDGSTGNDVDAVVLEVNGNLLAVNP